MTRVNIVLAMLVWASAFALVSSQYRVRHLTIEINRARDLAYQLETDRNRLTLPGIIKRFHTGLNTFSGLNLPGSILFKY